MALSRTHKLVAAGTAALAVVAGLAFFQPQRLLYDDTVQEAAPTPSAVAPDTPTPAAPAAPTADRLGTFRPLEHTVEGTARIVSADGKQFVRLEDFRVQNGPDLYVYLSAGPPDASGSAYGKDFVDLGRLKGNVGNQNYEIPAGTDLDRYPNVTIWCKRFATGFAVAPLA